MRILVTNDDGIGTEGIRRLAAMAAELGEVWVAAPKSQCSAMSQRITVRGELAVRREEFPVEGVHAYSVDGTPADCVKVALRYLLPERPNIVFSGINVGYNVGFDIAYSGTVGAAMEAKMQGIPAIAFSNQGNNVYEVAEKYLLSVTKDLLEREISADKIWNVNFPGCALSDFKGIREEQNPAQHQFYMDHYERRDTEDGFVLSAIGIPSSQAPGDGSDMSAVMSGYISIGKIKNMVLRAAD